MKIVKQSETTNKDSKVLKPETKRTRLYADGAKTGSVANGVWVNKHGVQTSRPVNSTANPVQFVASHKVRDYEGTYFPAMLVKSEKEGFGTLVAFKAGTVLVQACLAKNENRMPMTFAERDSTKGPHWQGKQTVVKGQLRGAPLIWVK